MKTHFLKSLVLFSILGLTTSCERQENDVNPQETSAGEIKAEAFEINPDTGKRMYNIQTFNLGSEIDIIHKNNNRSGKGAGVLNKNETLNSSWKDLTKSILFDMEDESGEKSFTYKNVDGLKNRFTVATQNDPHAKSRKDFYGLKESDRPKSIFIDGIRFGSKSNVNRYYRNVENIKFRAIGKIDKVLNVENSPFKKASKEEYSRKNNSNKTKDLTIDGGWNFSETTSISVSVKNTTKTEFEGGGKLFETLDIKVKTSFEQSVTNTNGSSTSKGFNLTTNGIEVSTPPGKTAHWALEKRTRTENYIWKGEFDFSGEIIGDHGKRKGKERHYTLDPNDFFYEYTSGGMELPTSIDYNNYQIKTWYEDN